MTLRHILLGSPEYIHATGLAVDATGDMYLSGSAEPPLSSSLGAVTHTYAPAGAATSGSNAVVARLHLTGSTLSTSYLTLIQGDADGTAQGIALDSSQNAYVAGSSASLHLPVTATRVLPVEHRRKIEL